MSIDSDRDTLATALPRVPHNLFAVVDGAFFDDLPKDIRNVDLEVRPLYLDAGSVDGILAGPHLISLPDDAAIKRFLGLLGNAPPAVFWSWRESEETLYRHLRKLAKVEIPIEGSSEEFELVLFRHADPNVMASTLAVLDPVQYARLLGNAAGLVMFASEGGGLRVVPRPAELPLNVPPGFLRFYRHQIEELGRTRLERSRMKVLRYLRQVSPEETTDFDDAALYKRVREYEFSGNELGLRSEAAHAQWAFLMLTTGGEMAKGRAVRDMLKNAENPDKSLDKLMGEIARLHAADARGVRILAGAATW